MANPKWTERKNYTFCPRRRRPSVIINYRKVKRIIIIIVVHFRCPCCTNNRVLVSVISDSLQRCMIVHKKCIFHPKQIRIYYFGDKITAIVDAKTPDPGANPEFRYEQEGSDYKKNFYLFYVLTKTVPQAFHRTLTPFHASLSLVNPLPFITHSICTSV